VAGGPFEKNGCASRAVLWRGNGSGKCGAVLQVVCSSQCARQVVRVLEKGRGGKAQQRVTRLCGEGCWHARAGMAFCRPRQCELKRKGAEGTALERQQTNVVMPKANEHLQSGIGGGGGGGGWAWGCVQIVAKGIRTTNKFQSTVAI